MYKQIFLLKRRSWARMSPFRLSGLKIFFLRLWLMPLFFSFLWVFYYNAFKDGLDETRWVLIQIPFAL